MACLWFFLKDSLAVMGWVGACKCWPPQDSMRLGEGEENRWCLIGACSLGPCSQLGVSPWLPSCLSDRAGNDRLGHVGYFLDLCAAAVASLEVASANAEWMEAGSYHAALVLCRLLKGDADQDFSHLLQWTSTSLLQNKDILRELLCFWIFSLHVYKTRIPRPSCSCRMGWQKSR